MEQFGSLSTHTSCLNDSGEKRDLNGLCKKFGFFSKIELAHKEPSHVLGLGINSYINSYWWCRSILRVKVWTILQYILAMQNWLVWQIRKVLRLVCLTFPKVRNKLDVFLARVRADVIVVCVCLSVRDRIEPKRLNRLGSNFAHMHVRES